MKLAAVAVLLAFPFSVVACAATVATGPGGSGSGGSGGTDGAGGAAVTASASTSATSTASSSAMSSSSTGMQGPCTNQQDCAELDDPCNAGNCFNGACVKSPANDGSACDDGKFCTDNDSCLAGVCVGGTARFCPAPDSCNLGQCDEVTKACDSLPGNDGASCDDNDPCTGAGLCASGVCAKGNPVDCTVFDGPCTIGVCDPQTGCKPIPVNDGTSCDDGKASPCSAGHCAVGACTSFPANEGGPCNDNKYCTINDACLAGSCVGQPNTCAAPGDVCMIGSCDEASQTCVAVPGNDGAACDDKNGCTTGETCAAGKCLGGQPANNGAMCDDGDGCTQGTTCANGACGSPVAMVVQCVNGDKCCPAGCAAQGDSDCSITKWSEGTQAWPDEACNSTFSFGACNTNAQPDADAWATAVCKQNGFTSGIWTGNKAPGCNGQISMWCQGQIPCNEIYETTCAPGDQTKVEFTCFP